MTNTEPAPPSPHWSDTERIEILSMIHDHPESSGAVLASINLIQPVVRNLSGGLIQLALEGLIEWVPKDGSPHRGGTLDDGRPHMWQLTETGNRMLAGGR